MVVVENDIGDTFQLRNNITNHQNNRNNNMAQNNIKSDDADEISNPNPTKPNMIYHQKKIRRKDSLSSYSSLEIHRIRNQDPNLLNRPAWTDARIALLQIKKGKATGNKPALILRSNVQRQLFQLGCTIQKHAGKFLIFGVLILSSLFGLGLNRGHIENRLEKLWVQEGGRLQEELRYVEDTLGAGAGATNELIIQTPSEYEEYGFGSTKNSLSTVLSSEALLLHLEVLKNASKVVVEKEDVTWKLKDLCYAPTIPLTEIQMIDGILDNLFPCALMTPLDCFWEGSKLLGPEYPVHIPLGADDGSMLVSWTSLNPMDLVQRMNSFGKDWDFNFNSFEDFMKRAGINTGYQEKPCLNPYDPDCPPTAPNKYSKMKPDIGAELTGGCYGFATRYMHWPEQLVVGGVTKNKTGHITRAKGLQSSVQLMGEKDLFDYWSDTYKVHTLEWSREKAFEILKEWQAKFSEEVSRLVENTNNVDKENKYSRKKYEIHAFSSSHLDSILKEFSEFNWRNIGLACGMMLLYCVWTFSRFSDIIRSQAGLAIGGVLLVIGTVAGGLGLCALIPFTRDFNAITTQVLPFIALAIGVNSMFSFVHVYFEHATTSPLIIYEEQVGEVLKRSGVSVILSSFCQIAAFLIACVIPIPALRAFTLQATVIILLNLFSMLIVFPAMLSLDLKRISANKLDIFCCYSHVKREREAQEDVEGSSGKNNQAFNTDNNTTLNNISMNNINIKNENKTEKPQHKMTVASVMVDSMKNLDSSKHLVVKEKCYAQPHALHLSAPNNNGATMKPDETEYDTNSWLPFDIPNWTLQKFSRIYYAEWINKSFMKSFAILTSIVLTAIGLWAVCWNGVSDGLALSDIVPKNTSVYSFLDAQHKYFGYYNMYVVTQGHFEYPQNQKIIYDYQNAFVRVPNLIKDDDGGLPEFWLSLFRTWLVKIQTAFDNDFAAGTIFEGGWHLSNASADGILGYKLLVQTGHVDYPVDETLLLRNRLVDAHGIINPSAFYNYLSAWYSNDAMAYSYSQGNLVPTPREWFHDARDEDLLVHKSSPIVYAQIPFHLYNLGEDTEAMVSMIRHVRGICKKYEDLGLPNFPTGLPFTFWEQYLELRSWLGVAVGAILAVIFVVVLIVFFSATMAAIAVAMVGSLILHLFGAMGLMGVQLNAILAVILVFAGGMGLQFVILILEAFISFIGSRKRRVMMAIRHVFVPVINGAFSTFFGLFFLVFSNFDFIVRYFFFVLSALILLGLLHGLVFLPVLLALVGPPAQVIPQDDGDSLHQIDPPTPEPSPNIGSSATVRHHRTSSAHSSYSTSRSSNQKYQNRAPSRGLDGKRNHLSIPAKPPMPPTVPKRHNCSIESLSTIAEESLHSYASNYSEYDKQDCQKGHYGNHHQGSEYQQYPSQVSSSLTPASSLNGASVFVEPHVVVETTTYPNSSNYTNNSGSSSRCSTPNSQVTKVTATAKFKVEVHAPTVSGSDSPVHQLPSQHGQQYGSLNSTNSRHSRRTRRTSSSKKEASKEAAPSFDVPTSASVQSNLSDSLRSSLTNSVTSSLSSNDGDLGFSEK